MDNGSANINQSAKELSEIYKVDLDRVKRIFTRLIDIDWLLIKPNYRGPLEIALNSMDRDDALDLFENTDLRILARRVFTWAYLQDEMTPFYDFDELLELLEKYREYLDRREQSYEPVGRFEESSWFDCYLGGNYFRKLALEENRTFFGDSYISLMGALSNTDIKNIVIQDRTKMRFSSQSYAVDGNKIERAIDDEQQEQNASKSYEAILQQLKDNDTGLRTKYLYAKTKILEIITDAIKSQNGDIIVENGMQMLASELMWEEFLSIWDCDKKVLKLYREISELIKEEPKMKKDRFELYVTLFLPAAPYYFGLADLLFALGHIEKELSLGAYKKARQKMKLIFPVDYSSRSFYNYFRLLSLGNKRELDSALDCFAEALSEEVKFWDAFVDRVFNHLSKHMFASVIIPPQNVRAEYKEDFRKSMERYCGYLQDCCKFGRIPPFKEEVYPVVRKTKENDDEEQPIYESGQIRVYEDRVYDADGILFKKSDDCRRTWYRGVDSEREWSKNGSVLASIIRVLFESYLNAARRSETDSGKHHDTIMVESDYSNSKFHNAVAGGKTCYHKTLIIKTGTSGSWKLDLPDTGENNSK